jgi:hypothetical protein
MYLSICNCYVRIWRSNNSIILVYGLQAFLSCAVILDFSLLFDLRNLKASRLLSSIWFDLGNTFWPGVQEGRGREPAPPLGVYRGLSHAAPALLSGLGVSVIKEDRWRVWEFNATEMLWSLMCCRVFLCNMMCWHGYPWRGTGSILLSRLLNETQRMTSR